MGILAPLKRMILSYQVKLEQITADDKIILVVGPSGAGKSTFINAAANPPGGEFKEFTRVSRGLKPCTKTIHTIKCEFSDTNQGHIVLVDVPALDGTVKMADMAAPMLKEWTNKSNAEIFGVLYLQSVEINRMTNKPEQEIRELTSFVCRAGGEWTPKQIVLVTTNWQIPPKSHHERNEKSIGDTYWRKMIQEGGSMVRFDDLTHEAAWRAIGQLTSQVQTTRK